MDASTYQKFASRTLLDKPGFELTPEETRLVWNSLGLAGEAGEVADLVKKQIFHRHGLDVEPIVKELGDCLWYIAAICNVLDIDLSDVMQANIDKLKARYPEGYSPEASRKRLPL